MIREKRKKNPDYEIATGDCKKEVINEDLEANDVWIPKMKTKLVLKMIMNRKNKFLDFSFLYQKVILINVDQYIFSFYIIWLSDPLNPKLMPKKV